jgi:L-threonylcarbamoyladenylate synthase
VGVESTILQVEDDRVKLLRLGGIPLEQIESFVGPVEKNANCGQDNPVAPGMLASHYAPRAPLRIMAEIPLRAEQPKTGLLLLKQVQPFQGYESVEILSPSGDVVVAAARFFQALHRLDALGLDIILATEFPEEGLGRALNDRLRRAAFEEPPTS